MSIETNAEQVARALEESIPAIKRGVQAGLTRWAIDVDEGHKRNLRGGLDDSPGSYPVPLRRGNLMRSAHYAIQPMQAMAFNTAAYAHAIHDGKQGPEHVSAHTRQVRKVFGKDMGHMVIQHIPAHARQRNTAGRPFLEDAANEVDAIALLREELRRELGQRWAL